MLFARTGLIRLGPAPSPRFMATKLLPVVLCSAGALYFGNVAYLSLSVAFIQIIKVLSCEEFLRASAPHMLMAQAIPLP